MDTSKHYNNKKRYSKNPLKNYVVGILIIFLCSQSLIAQVGIGTTTPDASSVLDVTSTEGGILVPRMTQTNRNNITTPATGLLIYQTDNTPGFYFYDGSAWIAIGAGDKNTLDQAYDQGGPGAGRTISANDGVVTIAGEDGILVTGTYGSGDDILISGPGTRMFFNPKKAAFRAGTVNGSQWDNFLIGDYSTAIGFSTYATGEGSTALGYTTWATGERSTALGYATQASGDYSTAMGYGLSSLGASGDYSTVMGYATLASGDYSIAIGRQTDATGENSTAMGFNTSATGTYSTVMGYNSTATGNSSTAIGAVSTASGLASTAMGNSSIASGDNSTTMGTLTVASGLNSTAMGNSSIASGLNSIAMGRNAEASGDFSIAMGIHNQTPSYAETSLGSYNTLYAHMSVNNSDNLDRIFSIGNGTDELNRSNALIIYKSGLMNINDEYDMPLTDGTANQIMATNGAGVVSFVDASTVFTDTQNTLDQAYDQGGAGTGRVITADNGAVEINGLNPNNSSLIVTNTSGSGGAITAGSFSATGGFQTVEPTAVFATATGQNGNVIAVDASIGDSTSPLVSGSITNYGLKSVVTDSNLTNASTTNYGVFSYANGGDVNWAGYFGDPTATGASITGNVYVKDVLQVDRGLVYRPNGAATIIGNILQYTDTNGGLDAVDPSTIFTDNQNISGSGLLGTDLTIGIQNGTSEVVDLSSLGNTLDEAYDQGGVGAGRTINTTDGALLLNGDDGLEVLGDSANIFITNTDETESGILFRDSNGITTQYANILYHSGAANALNFYNESATAMMTLDDNQFVGIGGDPNANLHVFHGLNAGSDGFKIESTGANSNYWRMYTVNSSGNLNLFSRLQGNVTVGNFNDATGVYTSTSDRRLKKDFKPLPFSWQNFMQLETLSYLYKVQKDDKRSLGLIAQDVELIYPELVSYNTESDVYHLNYSGFGVVAIKAVQELKEEVDTLKQENAILKAKLDKLELLEARLSALEASAQTKTSSAINR